MFTLFFFFLYIIRNKPIRYKKYNKLQNLQKNKEKITEGTSENYTK